MNGRAFADVKSQIISYLQRADMDKLRQTFAASLQKNAAIQDFLVGPAPLRSASHGKSRALNTLTVRQRTEIGAFFSENAPVTPFFDTNFQQFCMFK